jgi:hypothetical protein
VHADYATLTPPDSGLWRVGRAADPYSTRPPEAIDESDAKAGNRFDSARGDYSVRYFATLPEACFGETLAALRPHVAMQALIEEEWRERGFMLVGSIPADWRTKRLLVKAQIAGTFFDVEADTSRVFLEEQTSFARNLAGYNVTHLDVATMRGADRRVTRQVSQWIHDQTGTDGKPTYAGIRYLSRMDTTWECWAVFDRTEIVEIERHTITSRLSALEAVGKRWNIVIH